MMSKFLKDVDVFPRSFQCPSYHKQKREQRYALHFRARERLGSVDNRLNFSRAPQNFKRK